MRFLKKFKRKSKGERLEDLVVKKQMMEEKAKEMEFKAELHSGIKKAKKKIYESSPAFRAIGKLQEGAKKAKPFLEKSMENVGGDLGMGGGTDIFGSEPAPRKSKKKSKKRKRKFKRNPRARSDPFGLDIGF